MIHSSLKSSVCRSIHRCTTSLNPTSKSCLVAATRRINRHGLKSKRSLSSLHAAARDDENNHMEAIEREINMIQNKARDITNNRKINLNSPKQIASALYGADYSKGNNGTGRDILERMASWSQEDIGINEKLKFRRDLSKVVLQYRDLKKLKQQMMEYQSSSTATSTSKTSSVKSPSLSGISASFSTLAAPSSMDDDDITPKSLTFGDTVDALFTPPRRTTKPKIDPFWQDALHQVTKPSAKELVSQLNFDCPLGFTPRTKTAGQKGSLLRYIRDQKMKYPDMVLLTRVGEFYEAFGIDAIMLVQHCGLNPMGSKARAGCPIKNIQQVLDSLTSVGFRVAVYEEANDTSPTARIKNRMLTQIISPAEPAYLYNLVLSDNERTMDALFGIPSARPYVGIIHKKSGYDIVEVSYSERTVRVTERVTTEAVACRLASYPPADPLFYIPAIEEETSGRRLPFLPSRWETDRDGPGSRTRVKELSPSTMPVASEGINDIQLSKQAILSALLQNTDFEPTGGNDDSEKKRLHHDDFVLISSLDGSSKLEDEDASSSTTTTFTKPLYVETASQLGLMNDPTIPSLVRQLLPDGAQTPARNFLRRWLLTPPPPHVASSMSKLVAYLKDDSPALPSFEIPPIGRVLSLIREGQASAQIFREVLMSLEATIDVLDMTSENQSDEFLSSLMDILRYECGIDAAPDNLKNRCLDAVQIIEEVINVDTNYRESDGDNVTIAEDIVPPVFFERNEKDWRGRIKPQASPDAYRDVANAVVALVQAIEADFLGVNNPIDVSKTKTAKDPIAHDAFNNQILLKAIPLWAEDKELYYHPRDRNGKRLTNRYTTYRVENALQSYVQACEDATAAVRAVLTQLSETLCETGHLPAITQAAHINLILSTATQHASQANVLGWNLAKIVEQDNNDVSSCHFNDLSPYWMDRSTSVLNSFDLDALFILTAPNMSGKSTVMRSAAAAALLTNCGFCAPVGPESSVKRFDFIFVRGASADVPTENKSAFGAEMGDVGSLLRVCTDKSLVFVDELGRGTSPEDGASIAGSILEEMAAAGMKGFFATHLHAILDLPFKAEAEENIAKKQMETLDDNGDDFRSSYKLIDGVCTDSKAFKTAARFGVPSHIIERAKELSSHLASKPKEMNQNEQLNYSFYKNCDDNDPLEKDTTSRNGRYRSIDDAMKLMKHHSGEDPSYIQPRWTPSPKFEGGSCVYILHIEGRFYVGETDGLSKRIRQHRSKGAEWADADILVVKVDGGKSHARNLESRMIQALAQDGFDMISTRDGSKIKPRP